MGSADVTFSGKLRSIQVLRAVAAFSVVALHSYMSSQSVVASPFRLGAAGVDLFFVISGFIITTIAPSRTPGAFLLDRAWRIYPLWFVALLPWLVQPATGWQAYVASATLWPMYDRFTLPLLELGWTLSFELLFYLGFAVALRTGATLPILAFAASLIGGMVTDHPMFDYFGNPIIFDFLMGVAIAKLPRRSVAAPWLIGLAIALFALSPWALYNGQIARSADTAMVRVVWWGIPSALLLYGFVGLEQRFGSRRFDFLVYAGDASYSIYLFHAALVFVSDVHWAVEIPVVIAVSLLLRRWIEVPLLRYAKRSRRWPDSPFRLHRRVEAT